VPAGLRLLRVDPLTAVLAVPSILRDGRRWASRRAWYLQAIAVAPEARRRGIGGTLVTDGLAVSDAQGEGCYLRTSHLATIAWYEGFGFEVIDPPIHVDASRRVRMRRRARIGQVVRVRERAG
jgi:ribosomal protein S18 acetylase RimI-like enzyme